MSTEFHIEYFKQAGKMVNPWGGAEAGVTHAITMLHGVGTADSAMFESMEIANLEVGVVMAALKGGVAIDSVRRPLADTRVVCEGVKKSDREEEAAGKL